MKKETTAIVVAGASLIASLILGFLVVPRVQKIELALTVLTQGSYETTTTAQLKEILAQAKAAPPQQAQPAQINAPVSPKK